MTTTSAAKLLPCPFCGCRPEIVPWHGGPKSKRRVECNNQDCDVMPAVCGDNEKVAAKRWNRRALPDDDGWQPIETAPKDGTQILAWCVHINAKYSKDPIEERWECPVIASWIDFNKGGWTWHGMAGTFTKWRPLPKPPESRG